MSGSWMTTRAWLLMLPLLAVMVGVIGWPLVDTIGLTFTDAKLVGTRWQLRRARQLRQDDHRVPTFQRTLITTTRIRRHLGCRRDGARRPRGAAARPGIPRPRRCCAR